MRGRFSKKLFEETCLSEYAQVFPAVCGDFAFYQFPSDSILGEAVPARRRAFRLGFKVPEQITVRAGRCIRVMARWPAWRIRRFSISDCLNRHFSAPLEPSARRWGC